MSSANNIEFVDTVHTEEPVLRMNARRDIKTGLDLADFSDPAVLKLWLLGLLALIALGVSLWQLRAAYRRAARPAAVVVTKKAE